MIVLPLGVGGAFTEKFYHNNFLITLHNKRILIDAGTSLRYSLPQAQISLSQIDYVFVTHLHFDHFGGIEELLLKSYWHFEGQEHRPLRPTFLMHPAQYDDFIAHLTPGLLNQHKTLHDFCHIIFSDTHDCFHFDNCSIQLIDLTDLHVEGMATYALKITDTVTRHNIIYSADVKHLEHSLLAQAIDDQTQAIFQDTSFSSNAVHATIDEVLNYYPTAVHPLLYAMHYEDWVDGKDTRIRLAKQGIPIIIKKLSRTSLHNNK